MNISEARLQINSILKQLEESTGAVVEHIALDRIEVTSVGSICEEFAVTVQIELKRNPGQRWDV